MRVEASVGRDADRYKIKEAVCCPTERWIENLGVIYQKSARKLGHLSTVNPLCTKMSVGEVYRGMMGLFTCKSIWVLLQLHIP